MGEFFSGKPRDQAATPCAGAGCGCVNGEFQTLDCNFGLSPEGVQHWRLGLDHLRAERFDVKTDGRRDISQSLFRSVAFSDDDPLEANRGAQSESRNPADSWPS